MHEHGLAKELWPQLRQVAELQGFVTVSLVEMIVGSLHGASAELLAHSFEHAFQGSRFDGAAARVAVVDPGQEFTPPNSDSPTIANGWEILIVRIEGRK